MTERAIIFSGPMVRAILDGRKTQTRRLLRLPKVQDRRGEWEATTVGGGGCVDSRGRPVPELPAVWHTQTAACVALCPRVGDRLWVREAWRTLHKNDDLKPAHLADDLDKIDYAATGFWRNPMWAWGRTRPSIHMPRWASRITLEVTGVKVERLQAISFDDAKAEGFEIRPEISDDIEVHRDAARDWFSDLWEALHKKPGTRWEDDPLVVAITFRRVDA